MQTYIHPYSVATFFFLPFSGFLFVRHAKILKAMESKMFYTIVQVVLLFISSIKFDNHRDFMSKIHYKRSRYVHNDSILLATMCWALCSWFYFLQSSAFQLTFNFDGFTKRFPYTQLCFVEFSVSHKIQYTNRLWETSSIWMHFVSRRKFQWKPFCLCAVESF